MISWTSQKKMNQGNIQQAAENTACGVRVSSLDDIPAGAWHVPQTLSVGYTNKLWRNG